MQFNFELTTRLDLEKADKIFFKSWSLKISYENELQNPEQYNNLNVRNISTIQKYRTIYHLIVFQNIFTYIFLLWNMKAKKKLEMHQANQAI